MIRRVVKTAFAGAITALGAERLFGTAPSRRRRPFIVCYHRVVEDVRSGPRYSLPAMLIAVRTLERQLDWLARRFELITLDEAALRFTSGVGGKRPAAAITFDDGYQDVHELAIPLLTRKGIPAAVFVVTDRVGSNVRHMHDRIYVLLARLFARKDRGLGIAAEALREAEIEDETLLPRFLTAPDAVAAAGIVLGALDSAELSRLVVLLEAATGVPTDATPEHALMDWPALDAIARAGFTVGSHGRTHALLANESASTVLHELLGSRLEIERRLGRGVHHVAYPAGSYDATSVRIAAAAGYRYGYATCRHRDPHLPELTIPRRVLWENSAAGASGSFSPALMAAQAYDLPGFGEGCGGHTRRARVSRPSVPGRAPVGTRAWPQAGR